MEAADPKRFLFKLDNGDSIILSRARSVEFRRTHQFYHVKRELYLWLVIGLLMWAWALSAHGVTLAWDAPADPSVTGYRVWWGTASGLYGDSSDAGPATTKTLSDDIFLPGVTYYFVARSYNAAGIESSDSNEVEWTRPPHRRPHLRPYLRPHRFRRRVQLQAAPEPTLSVDGDPWQWRWRI